MLETIESLFKTTDLYEILKISKEDAADAKKLRSAYLKGALLYHPDKAREAKDDEKEIYTKKFQILTKIVEILKDEDLRKCYNDTGEWPEDDSFNLSETDFKMDKSEFAAKYEEFKKAYQDSDEERSDIKRLYVEGNGSIVHIIDNLFCAEMLTDETRIISIIDDLIKRKKMKRIVVTQAQEKELKKRKTKAKKEAKEAEAMMEELGMANLPGSLEQTILARRETAQRSFLDDLEKRYCPPEKESKSKRVKRK